MDEDHVDQSVIGLCLRDHLLKLGTIIVGGARPAIDERFDEDGTLIGDPAFRMGDLIWDHCKICLNSQWSSGERGQISLE